MYNINDIVNTILCGDVLEHLALIPDNSIDLVVTSPPYNLGIDYKVYKDNMERDAYYKWCENWLNQLFRIGKNDCRYCIVHYLSYGHNHGTDVNVSGRTAPLMTINSMAEEIGYKHHGLALWWDITLCKQTAWGSWASASSPYISSPFEGILILYKNQWKKIAENKHNDKIQKDEFMESCSGIWNIPTERDRSHPAPFPIKLSSRCINMLSYTGDIVLDPFMGSGTTGVSAERLKRNWIGIELNPDYAGKAIARINNERNQIKLF